MNSHLTKWEWSFVLAAGLIAALGVLYPASIYGAGVSSDSMFYLSSADNFAAGAGFTDFKGDPLIDFPPLYSFILGVLRAISGHILFSSGSGSQCRCHGPARGVSTGVLLRRCFPERRIWFYLGVLLTLVFLPLYTLGANIATDLLYILLTVWFCLAAQSYLENKRFAWLAAMTALAAACAMLRWIGLAVVAAQFLLVFIAYRHDMKKGFPLRCRLQRPGILARRVVDWRAQCLVERHMGARHAEFTVCRRVGESQAHGRAHAGMDGSKSGDDLRSGSGRFYSRNPDP